MASYRKHSHLFGDLQAELVDSRHLRIVEQPPFARPRAFMIDVACLAPGYLVEHPRAHAWLLAGVSAAVAAGGAFYLASAGLLPGAGWAGAALVAVAAACGLVFQVRRAPTLVLATRHAGVPLLRIRPFRAADGDLAPFLDILQARIGEAESKRGLSAERLRSGEIKTLRRLAAETVLSDAEYQQARERVLLVGT